MPYHELCSTSSHYWACLQEPNSSNNLAKSQYYSAPTFLLSILSYLLKLIVYCPR